MRRGTSVQAVWEAMFLVAPRRSLDRTPRKCGCSHLSLEALTCLSFEVWSGGWTDGGNSLASRDYELYGVASPSYSLALCTGHCEPPSKAARVAAENLLKLNPRRTRYPLGFETIAKFTGSVCSTHGESVRESAHRQRSPATRSHYEIARGREKALPPIIRRRYSYSAFRASTGSTAAARRAGR